MFIAALFTIAKTWKQPKCPLTNKWIWYIYTMVYCVYAQLLSCVCLLVTPWIAAHQAPLSVEFSKQEY